MVYITVELVGVNSRSLLRVKRKIVENLSAMEFPEGNIGMDVSSVETPEEVLIGLHVSLDPVEFEDCNKQDLLHEVYDAVSAAIEEVCPDYPEELDDFC